MKSHCYNSVTEISSRRFQTIYYKTSMWLGHLDLKPKNNKGNPFSINNFNVKFHCLCFIGHLINTDTLRTCMLLFYSYIYMAIHNQHSICKSMSLEEMEYGCTCSANLKVISQYSTLTYWISLQLTQLFTWAFPT